jgi:hypothetical protein
MSGGVTGGRMANTKSKAAGTDGEARTPIKTAWSSTICGVVLAGGAIAFAILNHQTADIYGEWLFDAIAVLFALVAAYTIVGVWTSRWRLLPDRIETKGPFRERTLPRAKVAGYRVLPSQAVHLESVDGPRHGLSVPLHVATNPVWAAWFETLKNLDAEAYNAELAILEKDARLGASPTARLETLDSLRRLARYASFVGLALGFWLMIYPRPYDLAVAINALVPLVALAVASRWPGLVALVHDTDTEPTINLSAFWFLPSGVLGLRAMLDLHMIDWVEPLCAGFGLAAIPLLLALRAERAARRPGMAVFSAVILFAWGYGVVSLANVRLDQAPPAIHRAVVVERGGSADDDPSLTVRAIDARANLPVIDGLAVSEARFNRSPVGSETCVAIFPGRLGWRYVVAVDCPVAAQP